MVVAPDVQVSLLKWWRKDEGDWSSHESGHMGYRKCHRMGGVAVYYDHAEEGRGICIDVSGRGCRELEQRSATGILRSLGWHGLLKYLTTTTGVHLTRLDVAIDDKSGLVDLEEVRRCVDGGLIVSRFKSAYVIEKKSLATGKGFGVTVNFGSRVSDLMVRMYNKAAEQKQESAGPWVRVELEAKDENASALASLLVGSVATAGRWWRASCGITSPSVTGT